MEGRSRKGKTRQVNSRNCVGTHTKHVMVIYCKILNIEIKKKILETLAVVSTFEMDDCRPMLRTKRQHKHSHVCKDNMIGILKKPRMTVSHYCDDSVN